MPSAPASTFDFVRSSTFCTMAHVVHRLAMELAPDLEPYDLTPTTLSVLGQLAAAPNQTPAELARTCDMSPQRMAGILQRLESVDLITRQGLRGRGRQTTITLTATAESRLVAVWPHLIEVGSPSSLGISGSEAEQLRELLLRALSPGRPDTDVHDPVVLVDRHGTVTGTAEKSTVHSTDTPLHLAFSSYLRAPDGKVLITRRGLSKQTWPGVWTNSACGHLRPDESAVQAAERRIPEELGTAPTGLRVVLPDFAYRAVDAGGTVEHELCPVLVGEIDPEALDPDPAEVAEHSWLTWPELSTCAASTPQLLSPWAVEQITRLGPDPWGAA